MKERSGISDIYKTKCEKHFNKHGRN
ncbi:MAG: hypothetical protein WCR45_00740 [Bacteroidaceae bacterium]|nr:DUF3826 domain-containing protein [Bacteroidaceae bacterium]